MQKTFLQLANAVCFVLMALAACGSVNKGPGLAPDSNIYHLSLFLLCGTYLFNYWSLQQSTSKKIASVADVVNVAACTLFFVAGSDKMARGVSDLVLLLIVLVPTAGTVLYLHQTQDSSKAGE